MKESYQKINRIATVFLLLQLLCFGCFTIAEGYLFFLYLTKAISFSTLVIVHLISVICLYVLLKLFYRPIIDKRVNAVSLLFTVLMGPFGSAVAIVGIGLLLFFKIFFSHKDKELLKYLFPEEEEDLAEEIYNRLIYGLDNFDADKLPTIFNDVLIYGSERQKRVVIERMLRYFRVEFAEVLQEALNDENNSIRVLAATAVTRIDKQYAEVNLFLNNRVESKPNDFEARIALAKQSDEYSKLGFIDEQRRNKYALMAKEHFERAVEIKPDDHRVRVSLAEVYYRLEKYREILDILEFVIESDSMLLDQAIKWYLSAMFQLKRYAAIREFTRTRQILLKEDSFEFDQLLYIIIIWKRGFDSETSPLGAV